jgi:hypothetical protein
MLTVLFVRTVEPMRSPSGVPAINLNTPPFIERREHENHGCR